MGIHKIKCGVPQSSISSPILLNLYIVSPGDVIRRRGINIRSYADDMQLYTDLSPGDTWPIDDIFNCILDGVFLHGWTKTFYFGLQ